MVLRAKFYLELDEQRERKFIPFITNKISWIFISLFDVLHHTYIHFDQRKKKYKLNLFNTCSSKDPAISSNFCLMQSFPSVKTNI